jgi:hypothetical protein
MQHHHKAHAHTDTHTHPHTHTHTLISSTIRSEREYQYLSSRNSVAAHGHRIVVRKELHTPEATRETILEHMHGEYLERHGAVELLLALADDLHAYLHHFGYTL